MILKYIQESILVEIKTRKYNEYMVCTSTTCKGKETFTLTEGGWRGTEGPKLMFTGLPHPTFFRKKGGAYTWGMCAYYEE